MISSYNLPSADSDWGGSIGDEILNMFNTESANDYGESAKNDIMSVLESALESADYSSKTADSNADPPKLVCWYGP